MEIKNQSERPVLNHAISLITEYLGKYSADIYRNFYADKKDEMIIESVGELLKEVVGEKKSTQLMESRFGNINPNQNEKKS